MAFTVTATESGSSANQGVYLLVKVLTNATETGGASNGGDNATIAPAQGTLTPNFSASYVAFSITGDGATPMGAAATGNTYDSNNTDATDNWGSAEGHYSGTVTASTPLTYGEGSTLGSDHQNFCAYEIPASGGSITVDGSSPALASTTAAKTVTTASFTPPAGSVLVAMIAAGGTGTGTGITMTMSDTSGLGLTWTQRAISSASDNFQPTWVFTTTISGGGGTSGPPLGQREPPSRPSFIVARPGWRNAAHSR